MPIRQKIDLAKKKPQCQRPMFGVSSYHPILTNLSWVYHFCDHESDNTLSLCTISFPSVHKTLREYMGFSRVHIHRIEQASKGKGELALSDCSVTSNQPCLAANSAPMPTTRIRLEPGEINIQLQVANVAPLFIHYSPDQLKVSLS